MKKQITKILLGTSLLIGGQALSQSDIPQKETFGLELISHNNLDLFKVKIYPNPSFISTVKMVWPDWAEITEVKMINISSNQERIIEVEEGNAGVEARVEEINDPEVMPTDTPVEYREYGEVEYLRGYNSCKDNEHLEFSDRLDQLNILIDTLKKEYVDLSEFYDPLRELMAKAIESIMQVELPESKDSISNIVSTMLEEMAIEADGEIRVFLNPNDAALLKDINSSSKSPVRLLSDHRLTRGSARAVMGDSIIESMKENRVADIVNQILGEKSKKITKPLRKKRINAKNIKPVRK